LSTNRPKIIHVTTTDLSLELLLGPQLEAFSTAGYDVVAASAPGPYVAAIEARGIRHVGLRNATRSMDPMRDAAAFVELARLFRTEAPDIVHTHNPKPGWYGRLAAGLARVPGVVNTVHGLYATPDDPWSRRAVVYSLERAASCFSDIELVQSSEDVEVLRRLRVPERKLVTLGNGIDLARFSPTADPGARARVRAELGLGDGDVVIGAVGRLVWEKGLREVLDAATRLRELAPPAQFVIVGPIDEAKSDGLSAADLPALERETGVRFVGERTDMEAVYAALDLYVLASHREGFPRSAMEAAAMGVPVVASDIRGCRQVVDDQRTGVLFPVGDGPALATALAELANDPSRRARLGIAAQAKATAEFDQERSISITLGAYERLLSRRGVPVPGGAQV
jgi:glycosyltransferase involved in cell wall biosynthesis